MNINYDAKATVFNSQTYSIHDGPGIRTTVFMKGCPLRCLWCANPESRRAVPELMTWPEKCSGCGACRDACPYGVIYMNAELGIAQKCTGCAHLLDHGAKMPRCVEACPTEAILFGEEAALEDDIDGAEVWKPETGLHPRVYYRNVPGTFIAGTLYDPEKKLIVEGARCLLSNGGKNWETVTDSFGDFWFRDLPAGGRYDLCISAAGYAEKRFSGISTEKSVNLDDIPLERI